MRNETILAANSADFCSPPKDDKAMHAVMTFRKVDSCLGLPTYQCSLAV